MRRPVLLFALVLIAFLFRTVAIVATDRGGVEFGDAHDYLAAARTICAENDYPSRGNLPFFRAPGLPSFLASATGCELERIVRAKLAIALADSLLPLLLFVLGVALTGSPLVGFLAAIAAALHPGLIYQTTDIRSEPLFTVLLTAALAAFAAARRNGRLALLVVAGATAAMAALVRPVGLVAIVFLAMACLIARGSPGKRLAGSALLLLGAAAALAPWTAFMAKKHGELILVNDAGGYNLWRGSHPALFRALAADDPAAYRAASTEFEFSLSPREAASVEAAAGSPMARSREWRRRAIAMIRAKPALSTRYALWKAVDFWQPGLNRFEYARSLALGSAIFNIALYALAATGLALLWRSRREAAWLLAAWIVTFWLAHVPFQVVSRFRTASLEPVLLLLAAIAVDAGIRSRSGRGESRTMSSREAGEESP